MEGVTVEETLNLNAIIYLNVGIEVPTNYNGLYLAFLGQTFYEVCTKMTYFWFCVRGSSLTGDWIVSLNP